MDGNKTEVAGSVSESIEKVVEMRTGGSVRDLRVDVHDHLIIISGHTNTYYAKQLASHAALDAVEDRECVTVTNDIEVA